MGNDDLIVTIYIAQLESNDNHMSFAMVTPIPVGNGGTQQWLITNVCHLLEVVKSGIAMNLCRPDAVVLISSSFGDLLNSLKNIAIFRM